jgi:hypothetical protein
MADKAAYKESDDHVPDATNQYGTVDTSGTAGTAHARLEEVTNVFDEARKQDLETAVRALDPKDDEVSSALVVLPGDARDADEAKKAIHDAHAAAQDKPAPKASASTAKATASS